MRRRLAHCALAALATIACIAATDALALTKLRDGFATMVVTDGVSLMPRNPVSRAEAGGDVYYWIQWEEPVPRSTLRCVVTGPDTDIDETQFFAEAEGKGFSICGMETEDSDAGTFTFTQYLDGEKVGERQFVLDKPPFFGKMSLRKRWKYLMAALGAVLLAGYWIRRKMTGDTRSFTEVIGGESKAGASIRDSLVIGSHVKPLPDAPTAAPPETNEREELRKGALQFQSLIAQPDKARGLDAGRRYISMLLKAGDKDQANEVFKQCVAADAAFRLAGADEVLPIAKAARAAGDPQLAVAALRGFDKAYPGHSLIPEVYVFSAKLMAEDLANAAMARKILEHILSKYPGHFTAPEAKRYLQSLA